VVRLPSPAPATMEPPGDFDPSRAANAQPCTREQNRNIHTRDVESICAPVVEPVCATRCFPVDSICTF
jgi:hypothetical protein